MDTVWPAGELALRPFRIENGRAMGPGVLDMKGGLVQISWALAALDALDLAPSREVVVLLNADEETGSRASRAAIETMAQGAAAVLVVEPGGPEGAAPRCSARAWGGTTWKLWAERPIPVPTNSTGSAPSWKWPGRSSASRKPLPAGTGPL